MFGSMPRTVLEAGVGAYRTCRSAPYWKYSVPCLLFEPCLKHFRENSLAATEYPRVQVIWGALYDNNVPVSFHDLSNGTSYLKCVRPRPKRYLSQHANRQAQVVPGKLLADYDPGTIDLAFLDMEHAEWFAISQMLSRPNIFIIELRRPNDKHYEHPDQDKILGWLNANGYERIGAKDMDIMFQRKA